MDADPVPIPDTISAPVATARSGRSIRTSTYRAKIAGRCRLITVTWCRNFSLHGFYVSVGMRDDGEACRCKVELKAWNVWRRHGSKRFAVEEGDTVQVVWDLRGARFHGDTEPRSDYYVAVVWRGEVALLLGDRDKDAYRRTGSRPALIDPSTLLSRKEHVFGREEFSTRMKPHGKGRSHEISIGCRNVTPGDGGAASGGAEPEMEIRIDGKVAARVKRLQWKFRGHECVRVGRSSGVEVSWDAHDWIFSSGPRHALFIFKPISMSATFETAAPAAGGEKVDGDGSNGVCLFFYAWKID